MGRQLIVATLVLALALGGPVMLEDATVSAQNGGCSCFASFEGIDSDLRPVGRYYNWTTLGASAVSCATSCDAWRREWFYENACNRPVRINRARNAWWGYEAGFVETFIGPDTWWCPFPPP